VAEARVERARATVGPDIDDTLLDAARDLERIIDAAFVPLQGELLRDYGISHLDTIAAEEDEFFEAAATLKGQAMEWIEAMAVTCERGH